MPRPQTTELVHTFLEAYVKQADYDAIIAHMGVLRTTGLVPSDCLKRGLDFADAYVKDEFPSAGIVIQLSVAAALWEIAAKKLGIHSQDRKQQKELELRMLLENKKEG